MGSTGRLSTANANSRPAPHPISRSGCIVSRFAPVHPPVLRVCSLSGRSPGKLPYRSPHPLTIRLHPLLATLHHLRLVVRPPARLGPRLEPLCSRWPSRLSSVTASVRVSWGETVHRRVGPERVRSGCILPRLGRWTTIRTGSTSSESCLARVVEPRMCRQTQQTSRSTASVSLASSHPVGPNALSSQPGR
jgi:hypothetical protein